MAGWRSHRGLGVRQELLLAVLPTVTVLLVLVFIEALARQQLLFASLASSAFLVYLDPEHRTNRVKALVLSQIGAAAIGWLCDGLLGSGYASAGLAMIMTIIGMVLLNIVHPPAVSTALGFGLRADDESSVLLFALAVGFTAALVAMQRGAVRLMHHWRSAPARGTMKGG